MNTKFFLDSGDPKETRAALEFMGKLDGQTTNPSLIAKNPEAVGKKFSQAEIYAFYKGVVSEISGLLSPEASVSIEVYADMQTKAEDMLKQAREFNLWIPNAHIKLPTTTEGLKAAEALVKEGIRVNMTLVFNQNQAAAVYSATKGAKKGDVFLSPFIGRLDDRGENGMDLIKNILEMYKAGDGHVEVLSASVRNMQHFMKCLEYQSDIITAPLKSFKEWVDAGRPETMATAANAELKPMPYEEVSLELPYLEYNIAHELTQKGVEKFAQDWNNLIE